MLVLQQLFNLSDQELEFQVNDRRSFENFVGPGVMNSIPDATTVAFFRDRLLKAGVIEELFEMFESYLRSQGLQARGGQIIDACQPTAKTEPALCIIKCYLQLVSRQDWSFPPSASPFRLIASPPVAALLGLFAIP